MQKPNRTLLKKNEVHMKKILLVVMGLFLLYGNSHAVSSLSHEEIQQRVTEIYVAT